jgi:superfamily II DNA helicase RecQ
VAELKPPQEAASKGPRQQGDQSDGGELLAELKQWRLERARADDVPAYVVLHDSTLEAIAEKRPGDEDALLAISGVGPTKCERYGPEILKICSSH